MSKKPIVLDIQWSGRTAISVCGRVGEERLWVYLRRMLKTHIQVPDEVPFQMWQNRVSHEVIEKFMKCMFLKRWVKMAGTLHLTHDYDKQLIIVERG